MGMWEKDESREEFKKKDEEICRLRNHSKNILEEVKRLKEEKKHGQNQEKTKILDEETTKRLEKEIYKRLRNPLFEP
jgi:hypothetical protein